MCKAQRDVYLSELLCLGYIGAFILLCIILLIRKKREESERRQHGSGHHLHLVHSLVNINNSMFQMKMGHRRSMSCLMDRVSNLEEHLNPDGEYRWRYENQSPRHRREHRATTSRSSRVSPDHISQNDFNLAEEKDHGLSQEKKELQAVINSLRRQNEELVERLEDMSKKVTFLQELKNSKDLQTEDLEKRLYAMEMSASEHIDAAEDLTIELFKAEYTNEDLIEDNIELHQQLSAEKQDRENVAKYLEKFEDAVGAMKASLLRDEQLSNPVSTQLRVKMEQLLSETQGFRSTQIPITDDPSCCTWPSPPGAL